MVYTVSADTASCAAAGEVATRRPARSRSVAARHVRQAQARKDEHVDIEDSMYVGENQEKEKREGPEPRVFAVTHPAARSENR
jgi:hypothetical protein